MSTGHLKKGHLVYKGVGHWGLAWKVVVTPGEAIWCIFVPVHVFFTENRGMCFPCTEGTV